MLLKNSRCCEKPTVNYSEQPAMTMEDGKMDMGMNMDMNMNMGMSCAPIYECPQERVCHTHTMINVPHIVPVNTRIINHQVYRHTYTPCYTSCYETEVSNIYDNNCCM